MLSEAPNNSARYMRITAFALLSHAILLVLEGSLMMYNHNPHHPHYHNHHVHDACHSLAFVLGTLLMFYAIVVLMIVFTKQARSEQWCIRALGLPNLVLICFMGIILFSLYLQYEEHDEHWFSFTLEMGCAGGILYIVYFLLSFSTNALSQLRSYAKVWVLLLGIPICAVALIFYYENLPIHKWIGLATILPYMAALLTSQRGRVGKVIKKL